MNLPIPEYIKTKGLWSKVFILAASAMLVFSYFHIDNRLSKIKDRQRTTQEDVTSIVTQFSGLKDDINVLNKKSEGLLGKADTIVARQGDLKDGLSSKADSVVSELRKLKDKTHALGAKIKGVSDKQDHIASMVRDLREINDRDAINRSTGTADRTPNVIMVISDTLRADHVSAINPLAEPKTVNIDRLARMGAVLDLPGQQRKKIFYQYFLDRAFRFLGCFALPLQYLIDALEKAFLQRPEPRPLLTFLRRFSPSDSLSGLEKGLLGP